MRGMREDGGPLHEEYIEPDVNDDGRSDLMRRYRANEYADLAGEDLPYPELRHTHEWERPEDYCRICGADGRA